MNRLLIGRIAGALVGAVLIAGCAESGEPMPSASVSGGSGWASGIVPSASAPVPSPAIPSLTKEEQFLEQIPTGARPNDLLGALEMAKFFIALHPGLYQGEDPGLFEFLSLAECEFCSSSVTVTRDRLAQGIVQVGGDFTVPSQVETAIMDYETDGTTTALVQFKVIEAPYEFVDGAGTVTLSRGEGWFLMSMALRYVDGAWRVFGVSTESCPEGVCL